MSLPRLENRHARHLFLDRHALAEPPEGPAKGARLTDLIERLGFVQVDSVNTVARAHDMILHARRTAYRPKALKQLLERDRTMFEHWTHDAAVIPTRFYPHWQLRFARDAELLAKRWKTWRRDGFDERFEPVLAHIRDNGPVTSSDVGEGEARGASGWWDWHPSKTALEYLWRTGALTVVGRDGFRKRYDLTERVIDTPIAAPNPDETIGWCCNSALDRLGFATSGEIAAFWDTVTPAEAKEWCKGQTTRGDLVEVEVTCADGRLRRVFARPDTLEHAPPEPWGGMRVLSPFDPALRDRARAERLFGFHYRIEIFTPAHKRKYGYYVFPLLEGDRLVGRIDTSADRKAGTLNVTALWPEAGVKWGKGRQARLESALDRTARFAGLEQVRFDNDWLRVSA